MITRRSLLGTTFGALVAASPAAAFSRRVSWSRKFPLSYDPADATPYYHPTLLRAEHVDELIWPAVKRINQSGWVWTLESCQGHPGGWSPVPLVRLVCHHGDAARMLGLLHRSAPIGREDGGASPQPPDKRMRVEVYRHVPPSQPGWFEARALAHGPHGIRLFDRFADAVNTVTGQAG